MLICKEFGVICRMSLLSIDILLTGLQEPEYVVGTRRAVGLFQRVVGWHLQGRDRFKFCVNVKNLKRSQQDISFVYDRD